MQATAFAPCGRMKGRNTRNKQPCSKQHPSSSSNNSSNSSLRCLNSSNRSLQRQITGCSVIDAAPGGLSRMPHGLLLKLIPGKAGSVNGPLGMSGCRSPTTHPVCSERSLTAPQQFCNVSCRIEGDQVRIAVLCFVQAFGQGFSVLQKCCSVYRSCVVQEHAHSDAYCSN